MSKHSNKIVNGPSDLELAYGLLKVHSADSAQVIFETDSMAWPIKINRIEATKAQNEFTIHGKCTDPTDPQNVIIHYSTSTRTGVLRS